ncbi:MAG: sterol desaturase family protein [Actinomycetota bacterium]|nr:sterol desaturase family protein [Actinomycetota bacterium]
MPGANDQQASTGRIGVAASDYEPPVPIETPAVFAWPPRPGAALRWILRMITYPWVLLYLGLSMAIWRWFPPSAEAMSTFAPGWILQIWFRNLLVLGGIAGGLHWWLYVRRAQGDEYKFNRRWPGGGAKFTFGHQTRDNAFWTMTSGAGFLSAYECLTHWAYASGLLSRPDWSTHPVVVLLMATLGVVWASTAHFWLNHRLIHTVPLYRTFHALHHRNPNPGPWTGISMHPLEHLVYFSVFLIWWVVPAHPLVLLMCMFYQGPGPAPSHSGFAKVRFGRVVIPAGDLFHQLHHRYFEVNYGNTQFPVDKWTGTWHDGTTVAHELLKGRQRADQTDLPGDVPGPAVGHAREVTQEITAGERSMQTGHVIEAATAEQMQ